MIQLQNNFTTPEQIKRLLELGVPADSANCYRVESELYDKGIRVRYSEYELNPEFFNVPNRIPCWSVGRLIEIYCLCTDVDLKIGLSEITLVEFMVKLIELLVNAKRMDFSKLEE